MDSAVGWEAEDVRTALVASHVLACDTCGENAVMPRTERAKNARATVVLENETM